MPDECTTSNIWIAGQAGTTQDDLATSTTMCFHPLEFQAVVMFAMAIFAVCIYFGWRSLKPISK